jgi:quercetin dioxygenase-like cupin family protein
MTDPASGDRPPIDILLRRDGSRGQLAVVEMTFPAGDHGPALHVPPGHGEGFYVLEGEMTFRVGDDVVTGGPGTFAFAPAGSAHTLANLGDRDARLLVLCAPAGFERHFDRLAAGQIGPPEDDAYSVGPSL